MEKRLIDFSSEIDGSDEYPDPGVQFDEQYGQGVSVCITDLVKIEF